MADGFYYYMGKGFFGKMFYFAAKDENVRRMMLEMDNLTEDISILNQITELTWQLHCAKNQLEDVLKEMLSSLSRQLSEQQTNESQLSYLEFTVNTA